MNNPGRLREHPDERLASPVQVIDLAAMAASLRAEPHPAIDGHRQMAVARHGPVTVILFAFDREGLLKEHQAEGEVLLHVLRGRLRVAADEETHEMGAGSVLALAPGMPHSVRALEPSDMLLTVHQLPPGPGAG